MKRRRFLSAFGGACGALAGIPILNLRLQPAIAAQSGRKIRIGQIGTDHAHAAGKMSAIRKLSELYEVVGIAEPNPERRKAAQNSPAYKGLNWLSEEQLLRAPGLQAVAIETEVRDLLDTAERAIAAGKHIHLDKPAGESLPHFRRILNDATTRGLIVQMGYMFRYNPAFQFLYQAVADGWLGELFSIDAVIGKAIASDERRKLLPYRGGAMFELGCHLIDSVVKLLGAPRNVAHYNRTTAKGGDAFPDNQLAVFEYTNATATVRSSLVEVEGMARRQFVVCGTQGTLDIRPLEPPHVRLALDRPRGSFVKGYQEVPMPRRPRYDAEFVDLAAAIHGKDAFGWSPEHDLETQRCVLLASGLPVA